LAADGRLNARPVSWLHDICGSRPDGAVIPVEVRDCNAEFLARVGI
jgi:hypothetical protein